MRKIHSTHQKVQTALIALCSAFLLHAPCTADESKNALQSGMSAFKSGKYADAAGHFGLALTTEFNNSVLHYYLGNCFVHMNQRDAAVREFRIAYALDPERDVGKFAKQALLGLNADFPASGAPTKTGKDNPAAQDDKSKTSAGSASPTTGSSMPTSAGSTGSTLVPKSTIEIGPGGKLIEHPPKPLPPLPIPGQISGAPGQPQPVPAAGQPRPGSPPPGPLAHYDPNRRYRNDDAVRAAIELQLAAENLHELLLKQAKPGEHHLVPTGTNLYIRNYQTAPDVKKDSKKPGTK